MSQHTLKRALRWQAVLFRRRFRHGSADDRAFASARLADNKEGAVFGGVHDRLGDVPCDRDVGTGHDGFLEFRQPAACLFAVADQLRDIRLVTGRCFQGDAKGR